METQEAPAVRRSGHVRARTMIIGGRRSTPRALWWVRTPSFSSGVGSIVELSGYDAWFNHDRFRPSCDGTMLAGDFRAVALDFLRARDRSLIAAGQQRLFDPDEQISGPKRGRD